MLTLGFVHQPVHQPGRRPSPAVAAPRVPDLGNRPEMVREVEHRRDVRVAAAGGLVLPLSQLSELILPSAWKTLYSIS